MDSGLFWFTVLLGMCLGPGSARFAPIDEPNDDYSGSNNNLNLTIQFDTTTSHHHQGRLHVTLNASTHHLINITSLWPIFSHTHQSTLNLSSCFAILGIHSHELNFTLCNRAVSGQYEPVLNGTNLGLVWRYHYSEEVCLYNPHEHELTILILMNLYDNFHPIPGGCNIEFALENSPFILVHRNPQLSSGPLIDYIEFQPAALGSERSPGRQCGQLSGSRLHYDLYAFYVREDVNEPDKEGKYFHFLAQMSSRKWLTKQATLIRRIRPHDFVEHHHILDAATSTSESFTRIFVLTSLNQQIYFNILVTDGYDEDDDEKYHFGKLPTALESLDEIKVLLTQSRKGKFSSLYVPSQIVSHVAISNYVQLFISLSALALFSMIVSIIGYRHFILELFYFSFLLSLGSFLSVCSKFSTLHSSPNTPLPGVSTWLLLCSIVSSLMIASVWTELCRRSRNIRLAFCGHSLSLSICFIAFSCDLFISLSSSSTSALLTSSKYSYYLVVFAILAFHGLFLVYLDFFWLSSLSTSFISVFFLLLPLDLYFFSGILFRVLFHLFLILTHYPSNNENLVVTFITFTKEDIFLVVIFTFCVTGSIYWQLLSKLASKGYGFGCIATSSARGKISASSINPAVILRIDNDNDDDYDKNNEDSSNSSSNQQHSQHVHTQVKTIIRARSSRSPRSSMKLRSSRRRRLSSARSSITPPKRKLYRCKHCQNYSTSREKEGDCPGKRIRAGECKNSINNHHSPW